MIAITGVTGQLGRLVIAKLLESVAANELVAVARTPDKAADLAALGLQVRKGDYTQPETLAAAFAGVDKLLLISSSEVGQRVAQHANAIAAAKSAGVKLLAYTSILHANSTPLGLGDEHRQTEARLAQSGLPFVLLRNGWYTENYAASIPAALTYGVLLGSAGEGRIASAARADYAAAAAAVLLKDDQAGKVYELAGDASYTLSDFAAEVAKQSGKPVAYQDMPPTAFAAALRNAGLPEGVADLLADSDAGASQGGLFDDSRTLSSLIGRPTTPMPEVIRKALAA